MAIFVEHRLERAGVLAGLDQVHEQVVEVQRVLGERLVERVARLDVGLDRQHQLLHRRLVIADADDLERLHHRDAGAEHRGELAAKIAMSSGVTLPSRLKELAFLADLGRGDTLPAQVGTHLHLVLGETASLDLVSLPVLAFPDRRGTACRQRLQPWFNASSASVHGHSVDLVEARDAHLHLVQRRLAQAPDSLAAACSLMSSTLPPVMMMRPISSTPASPRRCPCGPYTRPCTGATDGSEYLEPGRDFLLVEALLQQGLVRHLDACLAVAAQAARQALGDDQAHRGRNGVRLHAHVDQTGEGLRRIVRVQRGEHQVAGLRRLDGDFGSLEVADFADHDDVGVLAQEWRAGHRPNVNPTVGMMLHLRSRLAAMISIGSSLVIIFVASVLRILVSGVKRIVFRFRSGR